MAFLQNELTSVPQILQDRWVRLTARPGQQEELQVSEINWT